MHNIIIYKIPSIKLLGNAKDFGECRDCVGKTVADLKLLDNTHWKYTFIIITHAPYIKV